MNGIVIEVIYHGSQKIKYFIRFGSGSIAPATIKLNFRAF